MIETATVLELILIVGLILVNGVFAMAEIAVVSSRRARLQQRADAGHAGARRALELAAHPNRLLSTVQIGITLIGILAGAYGGATLAAKLDVFLERVPVLAPYSEAMALGVVVAGITYLSVILGELVPKRIALLHPEAIAAAMAGPMDLVSRAATPLVNLLSLSTDGVLRLLGISRTSDVPVTEEEVTALIAQGAEAGVFEEVEQELVEGVFTLADQRVAALMTPRHRVVWLDLADEGEVNRAVLLQHRFTRYPVCDGDADEPVGMVDVRDLQAQLLRGEPLDLRAALREPLFVPEGARALDLLERFREAGVHLAIVIDEYGGTEGIVTLSDILGEIAGELSAGPESQVVQREDGSWLVDGAIPMEEFWEALGLEDQREAGRRGYRTLSGFVLAQLGRVPVVGERFEAFDLSFEVVDMDGRRIDRILVGRARTAPPPVA